METVTLEISGAEVRTIMDNIHREHGVVEIEHLIDALQFERKHLVDFGFFSWEQP